MSFELYKTEQAVIDKATGLLESGAFDTTEHKQAFEDLLGAYQKLLRSTRRIVRLSDRIEGDLNDMAIKHKAAAEEVSKKNAELEFVSNQLAKYLSPQVYESIFTGRQEVKIASRRKKLTVFFSDIAGFTETADRLESEDLTQLLNQYLTEMSRIALSYGATIDKYVGDAIVIFFGDPETRGVREDALACVRMALDMRSRMSELAQVWRKSGIERPLKCRIGINTGFCTVGNFGSEDRMDYTIIGGGVNLASRLETAASPGEILVSYETFAMVRDEIRCEERGAISVKGISHPVSTYQVMEPVQSGDAKREPLDETRPNLRFHIDVGAMSAEEREQAVAVLRRALDQLAGDGGEAVEQAGIRSART